MAWYLRTRASDNALPARSARNGIAVCRPAIGRAAAFALVVLCAPVCNAQVLQGILDRAKSAAQQAAQDKAARIATDAAQGSAGKPRTAAAKGAASGPTADAANSAATPAPAPAAAAAPAEQPAPAAAAADLPGQAPLPSRLAFTTKLASAVRTQDFRKGVPAELADANLPSRRTELANPYLPDNRRIFKVRAMAPHPAGGIIFWADARNLAAKDDDEEWSGLWRMQADGRVTPFAVETETQFQRAQLHCDGPFQKVTVGRPDELIVEPDESVVLAQGGSGVIVRVHRNGYVERIAGGGTDWCTRNNPSDIGYRDGPGVQALFSNKLAIARAADGGIYVAEENANTAEALNRIRHIDTQGVVTTTYRGEDCSGGHDCPPKTPGVDAIAVDRDGQLVVTASHLGRNARGQFQGRSTAHRIDPATGNTSLLALAADMIPMTGVAFASFTGVALAPDGRPIAVGLSPGGFVLLDGFKPTLDYWVHWRETDNDDGPVATSGFGGKPFCVAADGSVYAATTDHSVRRLDTATQRVTTWLR